MFVTSSRDEALQTRDSPKRGGSPWRWLRRGWVLNLSWRFRGLSERIWISVVKAAAMVAVVFLGGLAAGSGVLGSAGTGTTIGFDGVAVGASVSDQYDARAVNFQQGIIGNNVYCYPMVRQVPPGDAESGDRVAEISCANGEFPDSAVRGTLKRATQTISVRGGSFADPENPGATAQMTLNAYDANGLLVGSNTETVSEGHGFHTLLQVSSATANIVAFDVVSDSARLGIDDLVFDAPPAACVHVATRQQLVDAIAAGSRCVYVADKARIDLALGDNRTGAPDYEIHVPDGVTLESGRSPTRPGGLLYMSHAVRIQKVMLDLAGNTHLTGLRLTGFTANGTSPRDDTSGVRIAEVDDVVVDNNDISGWPNAGVFVYSAPNTRASVGRIRISDNLIHNNEGQDLGYGVVVGEGTGNALIERNVFSRNRHDIGGGNRSPHAGYIARWNFVLQPGWIDPLCNCYGGHFDFHGSIESTGWVGGAAGEYIEIRSNTIRGDQQVHSWSHKRAAFDIRGTPTDRAIFEDNVVVHPSENDAVVVSGVCGFLCDYRDRAWLKAEHKLFIRSNSYGVPAEAALAAGHFDGDGCTDAFQANGTAWWYSPCGSGAWRFLRPSTLRLNQLALGDFNDDGMTDVFTQSGDRWLVSDRGSGPLLPLPAGSSIPMSSYRFGDFDGDGTTDVFRTNGHQWYYSQAGATHWLQLQTSPSRLTSSASATSTATPGATSSASPTTSGPSPTAAPRPGSGSTRRSRPTSQNSSSPTSTATARPTSLAATTAPGKSPGTEPQPGNHSTSDVHIYTRSPGCCSATSTATNTPTPSSITSSSATSSQAQAQARS